MKCPFCGGLDDQVIDTRPNDLSSLIRRRRECGECKKRYTTYERVEETPLMVVKSDSRREPFNAKKLQSGISLACQKRPISMDAVERIVSEVEHELQDYLMEVPSKVIGEKVLKKLWDVDLVAYIRFASVYRQFADIDTFMEELKKLKKEHVRQQRTKLERKPLSA
ncbi:MAG: transcriptional regulator NrdR [Elusimicrobia bacterium]|nr:transcriptional regulator NrdR [Elusimicrobiota bacterium]